MRTNRSTKDFVRRLKTALHAVNRVFCLRDPLVAALGAEFSRAQVHSILALGFQPLSMSELGQRLAVSGPTITGMIDRLEKLGIVERRRSSDDRRVVTLHLTRKGRTLFDRFHAALDERLAELLDLLEVDERDVLVTLVERLAERFVGITEARTQRGAVHAEI